MTISMEIPPLPDRPDQMTPEQWDWLAGQIVEGLPPRVQLALALGMYQKLRRWLGVPAELPGAWPWTS